MEITNYFILNKQIFSNTLHHYKRNAKKNKIKLKDYNSYTELRRTIKIHKNDFIVAGKRVNDLSHVSFDAKERFEISLREAKTLKAKKRILRKFFKRNPELLI